MTGENRMVEIFSKRHYDESKIPEKSKQKTLGRINISSEQALKYSPANDITPLGENLFNPQEIERGIMSLIAVNKDPKSFMCPEFFFSYNPSIFGNPPVLYSPIIDEDVKKEFESIKDDEVSVYFNELSFEIKADEDEKRWWAPIKDRFIQKMRESDLSDDVWTEYFYYRGAKCSTSHNFVNTKELGQIFAYFFGKELHAFSCFVNTNIEISATYAIFEPYLIHENHGLWKGSISDFLKTTEIVSGTLAGIPRKPITYHSYEAIPHNLSGEIKLVHPSLGTLSMRARPYNVEVDTFSDTEQFRALSKRKYAIPQTLIISKDATELLKSERGLRFY